MDYQKLFYWLVVADNARTLFTTGIILFSFIALVASAANLLGDLNSEERERSRKWIWYSYPIVFLFWALYIFTPEKKDTLLIVAGGQTLNFLTTDSSTRKIPSELSGFIVNEIKTMAAESKVELGLQTQKEKILEEARHMTTDELLKRMRSDSTFTKMISK